MQTSQHQKISALIITYNEIGYIEPCISSISFADEIIVVDSYSTDGTYEYLKDHPKVKVIQKPFKNFTDQKTFTLKQANYEWVLFIDADEVVGQNLQNEILTVINGRNTCSAYWFYRTFMFKDKKLKFSGCQTDKNYRLFKKSEVMFSKDKLVHETLEVNGSSGILNSRLIHRSYKSYEDFTRKILNYGRMKAMETYGKKKKFTYAKLFLKPLWKFFNCYILRLGIFDGFKGMVIAYIHARGVIEHYLTLRTLELDSRNVGVVGNIFEKV